MNQSQTRTLLVGTSEFASKIFDHLSTFQILNIVGLITQPDKIFGRKKELTFSKTKTLFVEKYPTVQVFQPIIFKKEFQEILEKTKPELIIVCAYGKILPIEFINYPKFLSLNIHASLLPELRGATPIQSAILKRFEETGVTLQLMNEKMDEGDIICQGAITLQNNENTESLTKKLIEITKNLLDKNLGEYLNHKIHPKKQQGKPTYCYISDFTYDKGQIIDFSDAKLIDAKVRAFNPEPGAWVQNINIIRAQDNKIEKKIKLLSGKAVDFLELDRNIKTGDFFVKEKSIYIKCEIGFYQITELQVEGGKANLSSQFINSLK